MALASAYIGDMKASVRHPLLPNTNDPQLPATGCALGVATLFGWRQGCSRSVANFGHGFARIVCLAMCIGLIGAASSAEPWEESIRALAAQQAATAVPADRGQFAPRVEVLVGELDPRLRLVPCARIEPFIPPGSKPWGRSRIGMRCASGEARWVVYVPVTIRVWAAAWVARVPLSAGHTVLAEDLTQAPVDWAETTSPVLPNLDSAVGRVLAAPMQPGQALRAYHLRVRQWFAAGETVTVITQGEGFRVASEAVAITPGLEGQSARVRTEGGRVLTGTAVGDRRLEVPLS